MALVVSPISTLTLSLQDRDRNVGQLQMSVAQDWDIGDVEAAVINTIAPAIAALSDAVLIGWSITRSAAENAVVNAPEASDVERKGVFTYRAGRYPVRFEVPSIRNSLVVDFAPDAPLNVSDPAVAAFNNLIITGVLGALRPTSNRGEDVTTFAGAYKRHRGSKKG